MRPLLVRITSEKKPLSANNPYELTCEVVGSRPEPVITWWLGSVQLKETRETVSANFSPTKFNKLPDRTYFISVRVERDGSCQIRDRRETRNVISLPVVGLSTWNRRLRLSQLEQIVRNSSRDMKWIEVFYYLLISASLQGYSKFYFYLSRWEKINRFCLNFSFFTDKSRSERNHRRFNPNANSE